jgi:hypothetical protein
MALLTSLKAVLLGDPQVIPEPKCVVFTAKFSLARMDACIAVELNPLIIVIRKPADDSIFVLSQEANFIRLSSVILPGIIETTRRVLGIAISTALIGKE